MHGNEVKACTVAEAIGNGIAYATEDRKRYGLTLIADVCRNVSAAAPAKVSRAGWINPNEEVKGG